MAASELPASRGTHTGAEAHGEIERLTRPGAGGALLPKDSPARHGKRQTSSVVLLATSPNSSVPLAHRRTATTAPADDRGNAC